MSSDPINAPGSHGKAIFISCVIFPPISLLVLSLRLYCRTKLTSRHRLRRKFGWDDVAVIATFIFIVVFSALLSLATHHGFGLHVWQMTPELFSSFLKSIVIFSPPYILAVAGYKIAILLLYSRIFEWQQVYQWLCRLGIFVVCATAISNLCTTFLGCRPLQKFWNPRIPGYCFDDYAANAAFAAMYVFADFYIALLPLPIIWRSTLRTKKKARLTIILGIGIMCVQFILPL